MHCVMTCVLRVVQKGNQNVKNLSCWIEEIKDEACKRETFDTRVGLLECEEAEVALFFENSMWELSWVCLFEIKKKREKHTFGRVRARRTTTISEMEDIIPSPPPNKNEIDRTHLVGLAELATPRWNTNNSNSNNQQEQEQDRLMMISPTTKQPLRVNEQQQDENNHNSSRATTTRKLSVMKSIDSFKEFKSSINIFKGSTAAKKQHHDRIPSESSSDKHNRSTQRLTQQSPHTNLIHHHSSPSTIAHSILRSASSGLVHKELEEMDIQQLAAQNDHTAEALRKLDGLSSPRATRHSLRDTPTSTGPRRRPSRSNSRPSSPSPVSLRDRKERSRIEDQSTTPLKKTRTRSIASSKDSPLPTTEESYNISPSIHRSSFKPQPITTTQSHSHHSNKSLDRPSSASSSPRQALHSTTTGSSANNRHPKHSNHHHHHAESDGIVCSPKIGIASPNLPAIQTNCKRGSSSSTSHTTAGTATTIESRESTLATSASSSSFPSHHLAHYHQSHTNLPIRTSPTKSRGSIGSEASSVVSNSALGNEAGRQLLERSSSSNLITDPGGPNLSNIPPVPPLPKDYETFKAQPQSQSSRQPTHTTFSPEAHEPFSPCSATIDPQPTVTSPSCSASATSRFLHSLTNQKSPEDHSNFKSNKKWSLSAALGMNKTGHMSKDSAASSRHRKESGSSVLTTDTTTTTGFSGPGHKPSIGSGLSSRRTPSGIPFFSRKTSGNNNQSVINVSERSTSNLTESTTSQDSSTTGSKNKSSKALEKTTEGEVPGRKSMMSLNVFIRNSVHRRPTLSGSKISPSSVSHPSPSNDTPLAARSASSRHSLKSLPAKSSPIRDTHPLGYRTTPKKLSINILNGASSETSDALSPKKSTLGSKASNLIGRRRGKTVSVSGPSKEKVAMPPPLPPLQMSAINSTTSHRVASITSANSNLSSLNSKRRSIDYTTTSSLSSRGPRVRTLKESTTSLRKGLPTIDASPLRMDDELSDDGTKASKNPLTTAPVRQQVSKENIHVQLDDKNDCPVSPTKIPRAVFGSQKNDMMSPLPKIQSDDYYQASSNQLPDSGSEHTNEFGTIAGHHQTVTTTLNKRASGIQGSLIPRSRSGASNTSKTTERSSTNDLKGDHNKPSMIGGVNGNNNNNNESANEDYANTQQETSAAARLAAARRTVAKSQEVHAARVASRRLSTTQGSTAQADQSTVSEFGASMTSSGVTSSRSSRTIASKLTIPSRMSRSSTTSSLLSASEAVGHSSRASIGNSFRGGGRSTTDSRGNMSPTIGEEEAKGDEEMAQYVARQRSKKLMSGMTPAEVTKLFEFPKPIEPTQPMTTQEALRLYKNYLSDYEKGEILGYPKIYYVGSESLKKMAFEDKPNQNYGYDDERGDYLIVKNDHLIYRYEVIDVLGKGSFGQVLQCRDHKFGNMVAIKIIRNKRRFHHQALVEIRVLENLLTWDPEDKHCVLKMTDHFTFRGHLCIVNELLSINLYELIRNNSFNGFSTILIRRFTIQILTSLSLLRHHRVVHCDLKPENILLKHPLKSAIKTIDFGSSCFENEKVYTYIQSRFYRSPEVILGMNYHMAIDMWSLGCILAELYTGYPIFPGETESEQLACIMEVLGMPDKYLIDRSSRRKLFFDSTGSARPIVNSKGRRRRVGSKTLQSVLKSDDELFVDFISKCLAWDPERRLKPDPAMRHPWILAGRSRQPISQSSNLHTHHHHLSSSATSSSTITTSSSLNNLGSNSLNTSSSTSGGAGSTSSSIGTGAGRLSHGRFNSGTTSLNISSPRRKQIQPPPLGGGGTNSSIGTTNGLSSSTSTNANSNQNNSSSNTTNTNTNTNITNVGVGRHSVSYRTRTQSNTASRQSLKNTLNQHQHNQTQIILPSSISNLPHQSSTHHHPSTSTKISNSSSSGTSSSGSFTGGVAGNAHRTDDHSSSKLSHPASSSGNTNNSNTSSLTIAHSLVLVLYLPPILGIGVVGFDPGVFVLMGGFDGDTGGTLCGNFRTVW
ncbi:hypothetical protein PSTT_08238 [Puccinia striiformis]|uniref:dual-specificity kinase n=1 Tax=Puccinia striiformis TaxID=27350 RepID=A0A2S4VDA0_9BASI|nr:hypothetical protein PSTT_08238 [Puccinia striiformis]